jgi:hypothetical protein
MSRQAVSRLVEALRLVHQRLLLAMRRSFEKLHGRPVGPGALLQLAIHDPVFTWLAPMSRTLAELDARGAPDLTEAQAAVARLLDEPSAFRDAYLSCLQTDPDVVMAHARLRAVLGQASSSLAKK